MVRAALLVWTLVSFAPVLAHSSDLFTTPYRAYLLPDAFAVGDVNGDSKLDVVSDQGYRLGLGDGTLGPLVPFGDVTYGQVVVADINLDGYGDVIQLDSPYPGQSSGIRIRLGSAAGPGALGPLHGLKDPQPRLRVRDMNADGKPDLVVASPMDSLKVLIGDGLGGFPESMTVLSGIDPVNVVVGDFNRDGIPDAAVLSYRYLQPGYVSIHLGLGAGVLGTRHDYALPSETSGGLVAADVNGDGPLDLIASGYPGAVLRGRGDGTFEPAAPLAGTEALVCSGDFDGDGLIDLASYPGGNVITVQWQTPSGTLDSETLPVDLAGSEGFYELAAADLDGNGRADLVGGIGHEVRIFSGNPSRVFGTPGFLSNNGTAVHHLIDVADVDGDALPDYVGWVYQGAPIGIATGQFWIAKGLGDGNFAPVDSFSLGPGNVVESARIGDVNGDGRPDLVATEAIDCGFRCYGPANGMVFVSDAAGRFTQSRELSKLRPSPGLRIGDVNGDGYGDIVTLIISSTSGYPTISVILGAPGGPTDADVQTEVPGVIVGNFALADVNHDGRADVATYDGIRLARADGTFAAAIPFPSGWLGRPTIADLDGDGIPDLMVLVGDSNGKLHVKVGRGRGDGSFDPVFAFDYPNDNGLAGAGEYDDLVHVGDFDGDGRADIMFSDTPGSTLLLGRGGFTFDATAILGVHGLPADVDHDGRPDLVTTGWTYFNNGARNAVSVTPSVGSGSPMLALAGPNPVTTLLKARIAALLVPARLELWDIAGRRVRSLAIAPSSKPQTTPMPVAGLAPGAYILALRSADRVATRRVTILR